MNFSFGKKNISKEKGFSLMELLVVVALLIIILSVSLFNYDKFGKDVELENSVYSMALAIREAQVYGVNKALKDVTDPTSVIGTSYGYGIFFNSVQNDDLVAHYKQFVLFIDGDSGVRANNKVFDECSAVDGEDKCYSKIKLTKGNYISNIRLKKNGLWENNQSNVSIYFKRPNPDATISKSTLSRDYSDAEIEISSPGGEYKRYIRVSSTGSITISRTSAS